MNREDDLLGQMYKSTPFVYVPPIAAKPHIDKRSVKLVYHNFSCCQIASGLWVCFVSVAAGMNSAPDSSKSPQRLIIHLVAEATCYCQARNLFARKFGTHPQTLFFFMRPTS